MPNSDDTPSHSHVADALGTNSVSQKLAHECAWEALSTYILVRHIQNGIENLQVGETYVASLYRQTVVSFLFASIL